MRILIITGGRIDEDFALSLLEKEKFEHMIVVDGALAFWDKVEKNPDITCHFDHLVGDFDTISPEILKKYLDREDIEVHRFNPEKDYTDTDIALKLAIHLTKSETGKTEPPGRDKLFLSLILSQAAVEIPLFPKIFILLFPISNQTQVCCSPVLLFSR